MSLTSESVSGDDRIESTWEWCGDVASKLCVDPRIESAMQLPMSICELLWWWWRWFWMLFDGWWFDWLDGFDDDSNGSQCWISICSIFESPLRPQFPFMPLWPILFACKIKHFKLFTLNYGIVFRNVGSGLWKSLQKKVSLKEMSAYKPCIWMVIEV